MSNKYVSILEINEKLAGKKVVRSDSDDQDPAQGEIISVDSYSIWVSWGPNRTPEKHSKTSLLLVSKGFNFDKKLKWHGTELGELRRFVDQAYREGGTDKTRLTDDRDRHVHVELRLPLAPIPEASDVQSEF